MKKQYLLYSCIGMLLLVLSISNVVLWQKMSPSKEQAMTATSRAVVYPDGSGITDRSAANLESDGYLFIGSDPDTPDPWQTDYEDVRDAITANPGGTIGSGTAATGLNVSGTSDLDGAVTINDTQADTDFRVESDNIADIFEIDAGTDRLNFGSWYTTEGAAAIQAASYSVTSTSRASYYDIDYTDTGIVGITLDTDLVGYTGLVLGFCDSELNANTNNIQIGTEGAETINEANIYTLDADGECVWVRANGTNWHVINTYLE